MSYNLLEKTSTIIVVYSIYYCIIIHMLFECVTVHETHTELKKKSFLISDVS